MVELGDAVGNVVPQINTGGAVGLISNLVIWGAVMLGLLIVGYIGFVYLQRSRMYNYVVHIYYQEKGSRMPIFRTDRGGIFTNAKTGMKRFYLMKNNVGLKPDNIPFIFNGKGSKIVTLYQSGIKNFSFVNAHISPNPGFKMSVGEEDVNWAISAYASWKNRFQMKTFMEQYGHMILWALTIVGTLFIFWFVSEKFDVIGQAAGALEAASENLKNIQYGQVIQ